MTGTAAAPADNLRTGGQILVDQLRIHGVERVFCVPGESYLAVLDAFVDVPEIHVVTARQEGGAAIMAEAHGKLTGTPGVCFVTRGPGATNASAGMHIGFQDSTPMILFVGQVARATADREAFQEIDYRRMYGQLAKWVGQIEDPERIPELVSRAFHTAVNGRPGPVVLALPEDMLVQRAGVGDARRYREMQPAPPPEDMERLRGLLLKAERPMALLGGGGWDRQAVAGFETFAGAFDLPVAVSFRCQAYFDNRLDQYAGHAGVGADPALNDRIAAADLLLVAGARLGEVTTGGYTIVRPPVPEQTLIHVHPGAEELGRVYQPDLGINAGMKHFAAAAAALDAPESVPWSAWRADARGDHLAFLRPHPVPGDVQIGEIVAWLSDRLPEDAILCNGAGNYNTWLHRSFVFKGYRTQIGATSGSMGYGTPAAIAASLAEPERTVVNWTGDGCLLMHGQELATAMQYGAKVVNIVVNNGMLGSIRIHQERDYPTRVSATALRNPDFVALAEAYGLHGETVRTTDDFAPAFERCLAAARSSLIDLQVSPDAGTTTRSIGEIRDAALARLRPVG
ncbi:MAG: thiamine pyrophosphate-binding protein [Rhodospirillaceae bacterium]|nr:thiamine pyrophosphate-binding protein [Rhodospirillaceae bacterium]MYB13029.1 thiamine pyrophosphate-binding protein [Rhodospirillaceae bacterium]MYI51142.1 thiamine pyrophosphate-binding protein [Rhodospirillaceae bacterium]